MKAKPKGPDNKAYELVPSMELTASVNLVGHQALHNGPAGSRRPVPVFQGAKLMEEGKMHHSVEHLINPPGPAARPHSPEHTDSYTYCLLPPPYQGRPITPVYTMTHNMQRIPTASGLYGAGYMPITNYNAAALAALQKNAAVAAAAYGGYAGLRHAPGLPAAAFQVPIHDVYQTY
uniref:RNA-binding protein 47-like n=1 Tax=Oncorhynchus gorbuscha TaxID=8017 RepID=UPI001EAF0DD4|nr:RNA-binding protein 47-like [Oncorhynchus gorbuscha]